MGWSPGQYQVGGLWWPLVLPVLRSRDQSILCGGHSASAFVQPCPWAPGCSPARIGRVSPWPSERSWRGRASVATGPRPLGGFLEAGSSLRAEDVEAVDGGSPEMPSRRLTSGGRPPRCSLRGSFPRSRVSAPQSQGRPWHVTQLC